MLLTNKDMMKFQKDRSVDHQRAPGSEERKKITIFDRLYEEKEQYFEKKNHIDKSREEQEIKLCTFQPNIQNNPHRRSFDQFIVDQ